MRRIALAALALVALTACGSSQGSTTTTVTTSGDASSSSGGGSGTTSDPYTGYDEVFQLGNGTEVTCIEDTSGMSCDWGGR